MCGIVGFITNETKLHENSLASFLRQGLIVDTLRGDDSTGVFGVKHEPEETGPYWCKEVSDGYSFVHGQAYFDNFFDVSIYRAAVGHNRAATVGGVAVDSAHPFIVGPITLVHNGTLSRTSNLPTPMLGIEDCEVDSHAVAHNLAEHSVKDVVAKIDGAFTLVWHDARDDSMNIIRNSKRPLHITKAENQETLFFASEGGMLDFLAQRLHIKIGPIFFPKEGQHLKWLPDTPLTSPLVEELDLFADDWGKLGGYGAMGGYWDSTNGVWVDDDDDDWRNDYHRSRQPSGKYDPPTDDRVFVGGRKKPVPMLLQEELLKYDMVIEDRITFLPKVSMDIEEGRVQIYGLLPGGYKAVIYSALKATAGFMKRDWTVRPIAVYVKPSGEPTIIVKLVSTRGPNSPSGTKADDDKERSEVQVLGYDIDPDGCEMRYRGPYGLRYTIKDFLRMTRDGCSFCEQVIPAASHEELQWIDNGTKCLCATCTVNIYDKFDLNEEIPYEDG